MKTIKKMAMSSGNFAVGLGLGIALTSILTGCVGVVGGDPGYGGVVVAQPDVFLFGGHYDRGHDVHAYSDRGRVSRGEAHGGGGHHR